MGNIEHKINILSERHDELQSRISKLKLLKEEHSYREYNEIITEIKEINIKLDLLMNDID